MNSKTEELLYLLLWSTEKLMRPSFRNLTDSYEGWVYRNGLHRQLDRLSKHHWLEETHKLSGERLYRLTEEGRLHALGGRDPVACWSRLWDGNWHLVVFDVPITRNEHRRRLRRYLKARHFGVLQGSVWISPDPLGKERSILSGGIVDVNSLILLDARPCSGETDEDIVAAAWDFDEVNARYAECLSLLERCPVASPRSPSNVRNLVRWAEEERETWRKALGIDPLLPNCLLPKNYLGQKAWQRRIEVFRRANSSMEHWSAN